MISIPHPREPAERIELEEFEACALVRDIVEKISPRLRGRLLAELASLHRRAAETPRG